MLSGDEGDIGSDYFCIRWAMWICKDYHVALCSNHNESIHNVIYKSLDSLYTTTSILSNLILTTIRHLTNLKDRKSSSIKRKIDSLRNYVINRVQNPQCKILVFCNECCTCGENEYNES